MDASVVIAVYNKPEVLRLVLAAYARQSHSAFEVIIADDGSGPDIARVVEEANARYSFPIRHVWHEDRGWRKNVILNNAIRAAATDYLIFTDGDCLPHRLFVADHIREREGGYVLCARRVEMSARWSQHLTLRDVQDGRFERIGLMEWWDGISGKAHRIEDGLRFESPRLRDILHGEERGMLGSNFSVHRAALESVNGFDEEYDGPGCGEDSDVQFRLELAGVRCRSLRHRAIQYHLHHTRTEVPQRCIARYAQVRREGRMRCRRGLEHE